MPNQSVVFWIKLSFKQAFFFFINFFVSFCFFSIIRCFFLDNYFWLDYERFNSLTNKKAEKNYRKSNESCKWKSWKSCSCNLLLSPPPPPLLTATRKLASDLISQASRSRPWRRTVSESDWLPRPLRRQSSALQEWSWIGMQGCLLWRSPILENRSLR